MSTYNIHVGDQLFNLDKDDATALDMDQVNNTTFHVLKDKKAFQVEVVSNSDFHKISTIAVNGRNYDIKIDNSYDIMVAQMGLLEVSEAKSNNIMAPMPGYIVDIMVSPGDSIEEGTPLFVLSAMKMENVILSDGKGIIKSIEAQKDDSVTKGQLIIEMES